MDRPIDKLRREYCFRELSESAVAPDPYRQFDAWFDEAIRDRLLDPSAMTLATVDPNGRPSARIVLLKSFDCRGFVFYTDYRSRKAQHLAANPYAAMCICWNEHDRQVRIEGTVVKVPPEVSDEYFASRPRESQLGASASVQSSVIANRAALEEALADAERRFANGPVQRPAEWGGYRLTPDFFEFWQGREKRLHDRIRYTLGDNGKWIVERLSP